MSERNATIKKYAKKNGVPLWMVAERYRGGVTDSYFSRILRRNFSDDEEKEILSIIDAIAGEMALNRAGVNMTDELTIYFYNTFSYDISRIRTVEQKVDILSRMEETFRQAVRSKPSIRNELSEIYQSLKVQCEQAT